jgi:hypothetical protein
VLDRENARLKRVVADQLLENQALKVIAKDTSEPVAQTRCRSHDREPAGTALRAIREGFRLSVRQRTLSIEESNPRTGVGCAAHPRVALDSAAGYPCRSIRR